MSPTAVSPANPTNAATIVVLLCDIGTASGAGMSALAVAHLRHIAGSFYFVTLT